MTNRFLVGTRKGLFEWSRNGDGWRIDDVHFRGDPVNMLLETADGTLYACLDLGHFGAKLRRRRPGSSEWEECGVPVYPEGAEVNDGPPTGDGPPQKKPASMSEFWALEPVGPDQPNSLWAGTIPGGLFRSDDAGDSWQLIESLWDRPEREHWFGGGKDDPGIHSICVDPHDSNNIAVSVSCGGVWRTVDGGQNWEVEATGLRAEYMPPEMAGNPVAQDPHRVVQCPADPNTLWMQHHNGVFLSRDRGRSWQELDTPKPAVFGFAVAVHPADPDTAWLVPAEKDERRVPKDNRVVVSRTRDGGKSFEVLTSGLPAENAFDIVYRHALDVDATGNGLAFGSTTGSLWISENGGDHWQTLSVNLPMIYCVRFPI